MPTPRTSFVPIQRQRAFEQVLAQLQDTILRGELKPGDRLPNERLLAEQLGVGRPTVREALRVLEGLEIIAVRPGAGAASGSIITEQAGAALSGLLKMHLALGHFTAEELVETRLVLETWTIRTAAKNRTEAQLRNIEGILEQMEAHEHDRTKYLSLDAQFHLAIAAAAGNKLLAHLMQALREPIVHHMITGTGAWQDWEVVMKWAAPDHRNMFEAICEGDADRAEEALRHHLSFYSVPAQ